MPKTRYTKREVAHMHRIYRQTMSLTATAKVCGCHISTVAKYRDLQGWIKPEQLKECSGGNDTTLTPDIAIRLAGGWRLHMEDKDLCWIVGVTVGQLKMWLMRNTEITIIRTITKVGQDGKPIEGEVKRVAETIGLRDLREKERATLELSYNQKHDMVIEQAIKNGDRRTALRGLEWSLSKIKPDKYGDTGISIKNVLSQSQQQALASATYSVDDLNLPLETRKQILAKIRDKKQVEGN